MKDEVNPYMLSLSAATLKALDRFGSGKGLNQSPADKPDSNPNPRPVRTNNAPDPISPLRGSSYIPPKKPQPINWAHWELMPWVELQQAVALSVNVNPDNVTKVDDVLIKRMEIALSHVAAGSLPLEQYYANNQPKSPVALCKFADWAVKLNIPDLPPELVAMAARAPAQNTTTPAPVVDESAEHRRARWLDGYGSGERGAVQRVYENELLRNPKADRSFIGKQIKKAKKEKAQAKQAVAMFGQLVQDGKRTS